MPNTAYQLTSSTELALFSRCVGLLFSYARPALLIALLMGVIFVGLMWNAFPHSWLLLWLAAIAVVSVLRLWHVSAYFHAEPTPSAAKRWMFQYVAGSALAAALWGSAGVIFMPEHQPLYQVFTLMLLTGLSAAAATTYSSVLWAYRIFLWISMTPAGIAMFLRGDTDHIAVGAVIFIYTIMMSQRAAVMVNTTIVESIRHSLRVTELLELNESIINHTDSGITAYKVGGECILMNDAAARILGIPAGLDVSHNFRTNPSWQEYGLVDIAYKVLNTGIEKAVELPMHTIYGYDIWIAARLHRIMQGNQTILLIVFNEISPQRNALKQEGVETPAML
jgi:PAS domain-containing protein